MNLTDCFKIKMKEDLPINIVFLGDSITSAEWVHPNFRDIIEYVLKERFSNSWNIRAYNCGFDGSTSEDILKRIDEYVIPLNPNILIYEIGVNDGALDISIDSFEKNIKQILDKLKNNTDCIYLTTAPYSLSEKINERYRSYLKVIEKISLIFGFPLLDLNNYFKKLDLTKVYTFISEGNPAEDIQEGEIDPEHPNILGNAYIAKYLLEKIWNIEFDVRKYIDTLHAEIKYPRY